MLHQKLVYFSLAAFFILMFGSIAIIVGGNLSPIRADILATGSEVPAFSLPQLDGHLCEINPGPGQRTILVFAPDSELTTVQRDNIQSVTRRLSTQLPSSIPAIVQTVGIISDRHQVDTNLPARACDLILVDENHTLWPIAGIDHASATVCLVGTDGRLESRITITPEGMAQDDSQPARPPVNQLASRDFVFHQ